MMSNLLTPLHWLRVKEELTHPSEPPIVSTDRVPKYTFGKLPSSLDAEQWTLKDFAARKFPIRPLPLQIPTTLIPERFDAAVEDALQQRILSPGWLPPLQAVRSWLVQGTPEYLSFPGTLPTNSPHLIGPEEMVMTMESLARFQYQASSSDVIPSFVSISNRSIIKY